MIQLTQNIDELEGIVLVNGARLKSGSFEITQGDVTIATGGVTADTLIARKGLKLQSGTSTISNLTIDGMLGVGTTSPT